MIRAVVLVALCAFASCAGMREETIPPPPPELLRCFLLEADDFSHGPDMNRRHPLREYLDWLIRAWGEEYGLRPDDIRLYASYAAAPTRPGRDGPVAGEIACPAPGARAMEGRYRIILYREALLGRDVSHLYNTIAHEFKHVLQDASGDDVDCGRIARSSRLRKYEKEATRWANEVAPLTDCGTRNR